MKITKLFWSVVCLVACLALAFWGHESDLKMGFYTDDFGYLERYPKFSFSELFGVLNPHHQVHFFRPIMSVWFLLWGIGGHHSSVLMHAGSIVIFGTTAFLAGIFVHQLTKSSLAGVAMSYLFLMNNSFGEAVSWISSVGTLFAAMFSLLVFIFWLKLIEDKAPKARIFAWVFIVLAMLSKEDAAVLLLMLWVFNFALAYRNGKKPTVKKLFGVFLPAALIIPLFAWCELVALRSSQFDTDRGAVGLGHTAIDWVRVCSFSLRGVWTQMFGDPIASAQINPILYLIVLVGVLTMVLWKKHKLELGLLFVALVASMALPIASGAHSLASRFLYTPALWGMIAGVVLLNTAMHSTKQIVRFIGFAVILQIVIKHLSLPSSDEFVVWLLLGVIAIVCAIFALTFSMLRRELIYIGVLSVVMLIVKLNTDLLATFDKYVLLAVTVIGTLILLKKFNAQSLLQSAVVTLLIWSNVVTGVLFLVFSWINLPTKKQTFIESEFGDLLPVSGFEIPERKAA